MHAAPLSLRSGGIFPADAIWVKVSGGGGGKWSFDGKENFAAWQFGPLNVGEISRTSQARMAHPRHQGARDVQP